MGTVPYTLTEASEDDRSWLDQLRRRVYADLFVATWGEWDEARHRRHFAACLQRGHISIVSVEGSRVGMLQLLEEPGGLEVAEVQVDPAHQGRGIGTTILQDVLRRAEPEGVPVSLRVGHQNEAAIRLYERLGFQTVTRTDTHRLMRTAHDL